MSQLDEKVARRARIIVGYESVFGIDPNAHAMLDRDLMIAAIDRLHDGRRVCEDLDDERMFAWFSTLTDSHRKEREQRLLEERESEAGSSDAKSMIVANLRRQETQIKTLKHERDQLMHRCTDLRSQVERLECKASEVSSKLRQIDPEKETGRIEAAKREARADALAESAKEIVELRAQIEALKSDNASLRDSKKKLRDALERERNGTGIRRA